MLVPPLGLNLYELTPKQAEENLRWFLGKIPERIGYLSERCASDLAIPLECLDCSPESLKSIWKWFTETALIVQTPDEEIRLMQKQYAHLGDSFVNKTKLSVVTEFIVRDIGMYLGEVFTSASSNIKWDLLTKPKNDFFYNHPVLAGFEDYSFTPPFKAVFEPIHMAGIQAAKLLGGDKNDTNLFGVFNKWLKYMPQTA